MINQDKLITRIKQSGYTQMDIVRLTGLHQPRISEIMRGRTVNLKELIAFTKLFDCKVEDLMEMEK